MTACIIETDWNNGAKGLAVCPGASGGSQDRKHKTDSTPGAHFSQSKEIFNGKSEVKPTFFSVALVN